MRYEPNLWRTTSCIVCGKSFRDDCGWDFCSSECEEEDARYHTKCEGCGREQEEDTFTHGLCDNCLEEREEIGNEAV